MLRVPQLANPLVDTANQESQIQGRRGAPLAYFVPRQAPNPCEWKLQKLGICLLSLWDLRVASPLLHDLGIMHPSLFMLCASDIASLPQTNAPHKDSHNSILIDGNTLAYDLACSSTML